MMKRIIMLLSLLFILKAFGSTFYVGVPQEAVIKKKMELKNPDGSTHENTDTFYVRKEFILEPIKIIYQHSQTDLKTGIVKEDRPVAQLKWYSFSNFNNMNGMRFSVENTSVTPKIEPYKFDVNKRKLGTTFTSEPFLDFGVSVEDYAKGKDTLFKGEKCFWVKRNKVVSISKDGKLLDRIVKFAMVINPSLQSLNFPFISKQIVDRFGGGAIVYVESEGESGFKATLTYDYSDFTPQDKTLFDHYQKMYEDNIKLLQGL